MAKSPAKNDNSNEEQSRGAEPHLSFSIESILRRKGPYRATAQEIENVKEINSKQKVHLTSTRDDLLVRLPWLAYTRYSPPKIPRAKPRRGHRRHKLDRNPRIPFSSFQLAALETKFLQVHYLSSSEVSELSSKLCVSDHRVKIWFQNRRAREKRLRVSEGSGKPIRIDENN